MKKLSVLALFAMIVVMIGCAPPVRKVAINGYFYPTKRFATVEEVNARVAEDVASVKTDASPTIMTIKGSEGSSSVGVKIIFNKRVETIRIRNGNDEKNWVRDVFQPALKADPLLLETCKIYWKGTQTVSPTEKQNLYTTEDVKNVSVVTDSTIIGVKYKPETEKLKESDNCSIKSAELYLVKLAEDASARTEDYTKK